MNNNEKKGTPEIPDNKPESKEQPIMNKGTFGDARRKKQMKVVKFAYAFAILLALGGMLTAKIATEKALGNLRIKLAEELDLIVNRMQWVSDNMYNSEKGWFYHAADSASSNSGTYWLRAIGWYAAAIVDIMEARSLIGLRKMMLCR